VKKRYQRPKKSYDGVHSTGRSLSTLLPYVLSEVSSKCSERPDLIIEAWPEIIGQQLATMTKAISFIEGILLVKVKNSTLHSLLSQTDKPRILELLRERFPNATIRGVRFRIG